MGNFPHHKLANNTHSDAHVSLHTINQSINTFKEKPKQNKESSLVSQPRFMEVGLCCTNMERNFPFVESSRRHLSISISIYLYIFFFETRESKQPVHGIVVLYFELLFEINWSAI